MTSPSGQSTVSTAVVTGAAGGIGRAIANRLSREGVRLVLNDLDARRLDEAVAETGATGCACNAASEAGASELYRTAVAELGTIDAWFANAGVDTGRGLNSPESAWATSWEVNVLAHVRAARLLLPGWLERGTGRFVVTASAAGLLTVLDAPAYAVTKHGAVAFAEWLSATYRHRGVVVQAICPQGVRTPMFERAGAIKDLVSHDQALAPEDVADAVWLALGSDSFLVLPHPEVATYAAFRGTDRDGWLAGMNRLQRRLETQDVAE